MSAIRLPSSDKTFLHFLRTKRGTSGLPRIARVQKVSLERISSDQFRLLQTDSMDISRDREHDRTRSRDLLTGSARSRVSPVSGGR